MSEKPDAAADSPPSATRVTIVFPVAGKETDEDFRGFETADGETLIHRSLRSFRPFIPLIDKVVYIVLEEHERRFDIARRLAEDVPDVPFEIVRLASPTAGPAETVARGAAKRGLTGKAIVCDIDHRLDPAPLFRSIATNPACVVSLWPLAGEDLKRWSIACIAGDGTIAEVSERRLPNGAGRFSGVIGCYYFADIHAVMDRCLERGFKRFSEYFNDLASGGHPACGVAIEMAEFFGDEDRIRLLERAHARAAGTIFCDIDGTLIVHEDTPDYSRLPQLLPGSREKLRNWIAEGYHIVLCTARPQRDEPRLVEMLGELNIPYHRIVTGLPSGVRILINDRRPYEMFTAQAASLEIARDQGIAALEIQPKRHPAVLRRFEGGSFAETLLVEEDGRVFVRKRAAKDRNLGYHRLRDQFRTLERFAQLDPDLVPALHGEENNSHEYFYDMEFLDRHVQLAECDSGAQAAALDRLLDRFETGLYCHRTANPGATEDWFLRHLQSKIDPKMAAMSAHERLRPLLFGEGVDIDGMWYPTLDQLLGEIRRKDILPNFLPKFLSLVHGDLTFQNVMVGADGDAKVIDMEAQDSLEATELDLGKIFQSIHSQYETWSRQRTPLCEGVSPTNLKTNFKTTEPDGELLDAVCRRWSKILDCSRDAIDVKGQFYLGLHLVRMVPFRLKTSVDHAVYALATAIIHLDAAVAKASCGVASGNIDRRIRAAA